VHMCLIELASHVWCGSTLGWGKLEVWGCSSAKMAVNDCSHALGLVSVLCYITIVQYVPALRRCLGSRSTTACCVLADSLLARRHMQLRAGEAVVGVAEHLQCGVATAFYGIRSSATFTWCYVWFVCCSDSSRHVANLVAVDWAGSPTWLLLNGLDDPPWHH
jgi:hypothetical protein